MGARLTPAVTGVIVAGGRATRLGGIAKGLADIGGKRIIDRVAAVLSETTSSLIVSANERDAPAWIPGARVTADVLEGGGAAAGIHSAILAARSPVFAIGWDMPFVSSALVRLVAGYATDLEVDAIVPAGREPNLLEPLCAWYAPGVAGAIEAHWVKGRHGLHEVLRGLRIHVVDRDEIATIGQPERLFFNVNTPEDLETARAIAEQC